MNSKGLTLLEVILVVLLIGILSALFAIRGNPDATYGKLPTGNIELIVSAMKMYYIKYNSVTPFVNLNVDPNELGDINQILYLELSDTRFNYQIYKPDLTKSLIYIEAKRNAGDNSGKTLRYELDLEQIDTHKDEWAKDAFANKWPWHPK